mmetsp:Transcript_27223/g.42570  ORF Transcript_27223/g.42570 Transcript_27223/m.42570 type:complete len:304 (-) Transcript_27223:155-1066(-)
MSELVEGQTLGHGEGPPLAHALSAALGVSSDAALVAHNREADQVRDWFNQNLDSLEARKDKGVFTSEQLEYEVQQLIKERDLKLTVVAARTLKAQPNGRKGCRLTKKRKAASSETQEAGASESQAPEPQPDHQPSTSLESRGQGGVPHPKEKRGEARGSGGGSRGSGSTPSVVTWWTPSPIPTVSANNSNSKKRSVDSRVQNPGSGKRGREKRIPRQFRFKWQVIQAYDNLRKQKEEGNMEDPCLATARIFGVNKSQVSSWYSQRHAIAEKLGNVAAPLASAIRVAVEEVESSAQHAVATPVP